MSGGFNDKDEKRQREKKKEKKTKEEEGECRMVAAMVRGRRDGV